MLRSILRRSLQLSHSKTCLQPYATRAAGSWRWRTLLSRGLTSSSLMQHPARELHFSQDVNDRKNPDTESQTLQSSTAAVEEDPPQPNSIAVTVDGTTRLYSPLLLRDICQCDHCIDTSTKQKLYCTSDIPADIQVASSYADERGISMRWKSDVPGFDAKHTTHIDIAQLKSLSEDGSTTTWPSPPKRVVWDNALFNEDVEDIDYRAYMEDDFALHTAVQQLRTHGLLFLTNVPEDASSVVKITERIGPQKNTFYGSTWDVRSVPEAKNVAYTSQDLGFHMDLMYLEQPPHIQFLHCIRSSSLGGASLFTDSFKAVRDLAHTDPTAFEDLCRIDVSFHYDHPKSQYYYQKRPTIILPDPLHVHNAYITRDLYLAKRNQPPKPMENLPVEQIVDAVTWSPPFQAPFSAISTHRERFPNLQKTFNQQKRMKENVLGKDIAIYNKAAAAFNALIHRPEGIHERMMKPGECVLFDNRRVLHARRAFEVADAGKERWLRGSYLDRDPFMSKLRILQDRYGELPVKSQQVLHDSTLAAQTATA
nr:gamma-butyrobetaine dioxygenase [Quercus suber]